METEGLGDQDAGGGHASWTSAMSSYMLTHLANIVASGTRTSSGFKKCHLNACARAVNEKFNTTLTGEQIKNHLKTWQRKFAKLNRLRNLSAAGWDENNLMITLDLEHYNNYVKDHKSDAEFLNKPIENYAEMDIIFGNNMATGRYAKDSSAPLGSDHIEDDGDLNMISNNSEENGASSSANRSSKRIKFAENEDTQGLIQAFKYSSELISQAIIKSSSGNMDLPPDLIDQINGLSGFHDTHKSFYYVYLVENPHIGRAFYSAPFEYKLNFITKWISERFPG